MEPPDTPMEPTMPMSSLFLYCARPAAEGGMGDLTALESYSPCATLVCLCVKLDIWLVGSPCLPCLVALERRYDPLSAPIDSVLAL